MPQAASGGTIIMKGKTSMKKLLALLLCLLMVVAMLAGCKGTPGNDDLSSLGGTSGSDTPGTSAATSQRIDVSKYTVIRPEYPGTPVMAAAIQLKKDIDTLTKNQIGILDDWLKKGEQPDDEAYEILIGNTNRPQSASVLASLEGTGYVIRQVGNKIVIVGSTDAITADAVAYFYENYVVPTASEEGFFSIPEALNVINTDYSVIDMIKNNKCQYDVVYLEGLDAVADDKGKVDYQVELAKKVRQKIIDLTDANVRIKTDWVKKGTDTDELCEILIGTTTRPESAEAREAYAANEYGYSIIGNKIVVTGWNEQSIGFAADAFMKFLEESTVKNADGTKNISFISNASLTKTYSRWTVDVPEYEGGKLEGNVTCNNDQLEYYYTETSEAEYRAYRQKLEKAGYKLYTENEIVGNLFATYTNDKNMVHVYYVKYNNTVRLITGAAKGNAILPTNVDKAPAYEKITESKVTQMILQYAEKDNFGMCYVITLEDGSFIVFDSGGHSAKTTDYVRLFNLLNKLNERKDGNIVVAAWIMTHAHWDHHESFYQLCKTYGKKLTIEQFITNVPDTIVNHNSYNPDNFMDNDFPKASAAVKGGITWVKPHTGMKFWVRNALIEVLYTQEDLYPKLLHTFNDSTMVTRMTIGDQVITWLGDVQTEGSNIISKMYGSYIKSDIVQVAHHGYNGATRELYTLLKPSVLLWPTSLSNYVKQTDGTSSAAYRVVDKFIATDLGVTDIFVADEHNICLTLPYKPGSQAAQYIDVPAG